MKKLLTFAMLLMLVFAAACSQDSDDKGSKDEGTEETGSDDSAKSDDTDMKTELLNFQADVVDVLQENNAAFGEFEAAKATYYDSETADEDKPSEEDLNALMEKAKAAGPKAAEAIRAIEVPSSLEEYKSDIESALEDAAKSYEVRTENLTIENKEDAQKEADELFTSFETKFGEIFKDQGMVAPSFSAEL